MNDGIVTLCVDVDGHTTDGHGFGTDFQLCGCREVALFLECMVKTMRTPPTTKAKTQPDTAIPDTDRRYGDTKEWIIVNGHSYLVTTDETTHKTLKNIMNVDNTERLSNNTYNALQAAVVNDSATKTGIATMVNFGALQKVIKDAWIERGVGYQHVGQGISENTRTVILSSISNVLPMAVDPTKRIGTMKDTSFILNTFTFKALLTAFKMKQTGQNPYSFIMLGAFFALPYISPPSKLRNRSLVTGKELSVKTVTEQLANNCYKSAVGVTGNTYEQYAARCRDNAALWEEFADCISIEQTIDTETNRNRNKLSDFEERYRKFRSGTHYRKDETVLFDGHLFQVTYGGSAKEGEFPKIQEDDFQLEPPAGEGKIGFVTVYKLQMKYLQPLDDLFNDNNEGELLVNWMKHNNYKYPSEVVAEDSQIKAWTHVRKADGDMLQYHVYFYYKAANNQLEPQLVQTEPIDIDDYSTFSDKDFIFGLVNYDEGTRGGIQKDSGFSAFTQLFKLRRQAKQKSPATKSETKPKSPPKKPKSPAKPLAMSPTSPVTESVARNLEFPSPMLSTPGSQMGMEQGMNQMSMTAPQGNEQPEQMPDPGMNQMSMPGSQMRMKQEMPNAQMEMPGSLGTEQTEKMEIPGSPDSRMVTPANKPTQKSKSLPLAGAAGAAASKLSGIFSRSPKSTNATSVVDGRLPPKSGLDRVSKAGKVIASVITNPPPLPGGALHLSS